MQIIFRVCNKNGTGPYRDRKKYESVALRTMIDVHNDSKSHPGYWTESQDKTDSSSIENHRFGFDSIDALMEWFSKSDREILFKNGFFVQVLSVPSVPWVGRYSGQCLFKAGTETVIKTLSTLSI